MILDKAEQGFVYHLGNTPCNGQLMPGDSLEIMFLADLFDKFKGVRADVTFAYEGEEYKLRELCVDYKLYQND